jgi:uncharacterized protein DUF3352
MNHEIDSTPGQFPEPPTSPDGGAPGPIGGSLPPAPPTRSWFARYRRLLIPAGGLVAVGAASAAALVLVLTPRTSVEKMVPATVDVYAVANLDPSVSQKMNLLRAVHRFPDTSTDQKLAQQLDKALKDSGITFTGDVQPWLGAQVGVAVRIPQGNTDPPVAVFAVSKDDAKAAAALTKLRAGSQGQKYRWHDTSYGGITITVGAPSTTTTPASGGLKAGAYAIVDHVVVIASSEALIREIIDADQGRAARLVDSSDYKATLAKLPSDRLAVLYVNGKSIVSRLKDQLTTPMAAGLMGLKGLGDIDAFEGAALVLSAQQEGVAVDLAVSLNAGKLSPTTREALSHAGHPDAVIGWIPSSSDGFLAIANLKQTIQSALDQAGGEASVKQATDTIGLTGARGVLQHLTGDFALEAGVDGAFTPGGAILIGTDDAAAMRRFFGGILTLAFQGDSQLSSTTTYRGVSISTINIPRRDSGGLFVPSYAVVDGMGVLASTPAELRKVIDAHKDHNAITKDGTYAAAARASLAHPSAVFYLDLAKLVKVLEGAPSGMLGKPLDARTRANLSPLKAVMVSAQTAADGVMERLVVFIQ